jgi:hypothetical protein
VAVEGFWRHHDGMQLLEAIKAAGGVELTKADLMRRAREARREPEALPERAIRIRDEEG